MLRLAVSLRVHLKSKEGDHVLQERALPSKELLPGTSQECSRRRSLPNLNTLTWHKCMQHLRIITEIARRSRPIWLTKPPNTIACTPKARPAPRPSLERHSPAPGRRCRPAQSQGRTPFAGH